MRLLPSAASAVAILLTAPAISAATYYVRTDGGNPFQCLGTTDAAYSGSGSNQACAWAHPFWALDGNGAWRISGGDTVIIGSGSYMMGYGAPNTGWCDMNWTYDCRLPPLPSGAAHRTRLLGKGFDSGCPVAPELWGTERAYAIIDLTNTSHADVECLDVTDHSGCIEFHSGGVTCVRDAYPHGPWASTGIISSNSSDVALRHLDVHGLANGGVWAGGLTDWTVEHVRIAGNGWSGWNFDMSVEADNNRGTMTFRHFTVEWNGCSESYPPGQYDNCWAQGANGYGDGVGTANTGGHWIIEDSLFRYNTSDGLDLLYLGRLQGEPAAAEIRRVTAYGNAGNQLKVGGNSTFVNVLAVSNCGFFFEKPFGSLMGGLLSGDNCRAGGAAIAVSLHKGERADIVNSTIVGQGDVLVEIECDTYLDNCDGTEQARVQNSILMGYGDFRDPGDLTGYLWDPQNYAAGRLDYNVMHQGKAYACPVGAHDQCGDPLFVEDALESFDGHLQALSPALNNGLPVGGLGGLVPADDIEGNARPSGAGVERGAYEYNALPPQDGGSDAGAPDGSGLSDASGISDVSDAGADDAGSFDGGDAAVQADSGTDANAPDAVGDSSYPSDTSYPADASTDAAPGDGGRDAGPADAGKPGDSENHGECGPGTRLLNGVCTVVCSGGALAADGACPAEEAGESAGGCGCATAGSGI